MVQSVHNKDFVNQKLIECNKSYTKMDELTDDDIDHLFSSNRRRVIVQLDRFQTLLRHIKPILGNYLLVDIVGRIVWQATAITNSMLQLAEHKNDYGVESLIRKLFECYLLLHYLYTNKNKSEIIAKIMAYHFFEIQDSLAAPKAKKKENRKEVIAMVEQIVKGYKEDSSIFDFFLKTISGERKHWHWSEQSFKKIADEAQNFDNTSGDKKAHRLGQLDLYNKLAHIDVNTDRLIDLPNGETIYSSPLEGSMRRLAGLLGSAMLINQDIFEILEKWQKLNWI